MLKLHRLPNGLRVLINQDQAVRTASVGLYIKAGSVFESPNENGLAHFVEHMAFKGSHTHTTNEIALAIDRLGGGVNAATSKISTEYTLQAENDDFAQALDLLHEIALCPRMDQAEVERERNVILQEIAMEEDTPENLAYNLSCKALYGDQALGQSVLGCKDNIKAIQAKDLNAFHQRYYRPQNAVLSVLSAIEEEKVLEALLQNFGLWDGKEPGLAYPDQACLTEGKRLALPKKLEQMQLTLAYPGSGIGDENGYAEKALSLILGGGVSSRLFRRIREEEGLAYSIYAVRNRYPNCGDIMIEAAISPKNTHKALKLIKQEIELIARKGVSAQELEFAQKQMRFGRMSAFEIPFARMAILGEALLYRDELPDEELEMKKINALSINDVNLAAERVFSVPFTLTLVGQSADKQLAKEA